MMGQEPGGSAGEAQPQVVVTALPMKDSATESSYQL